MLLYITHGLDIGLFQLCAEEGFCAQFDPNSTQNTGCIGSLSWEKLVAEASSVRNRNDLRKVPRLRSCWTPGALGRQSLDKTIRPN